MVRLILCAEQGYNNMDYRNGLWRREVQVKTFTNIRIELPYDRILKRLGRNRHLVRETPRQRAVVDAHIEAGYALCRCAGVSGRCEIVANRAGQVELSGGGAFRSAALGRLLERSGEALLLAATAGAELVAAISDAFRADDGVRAAVLDAVGSEVADCLLDWLQAAAERQLVREVKKLTDLRFSPGYGDLGLESQATIFSLLGLERLGLRLTDSYMLEPEKSVIGIVGIE